jgi:S-formylglutathione hydrolase FrmB
MSRISFLLLLITAAGSLASAQSRIDCSAVNSRLLQQKVHYCVSVPEGYDKAVAAHAAGYPVLYFLHGLGDNEQSLFNTGGWNVIQDLRQQKKIGDFLIVAPEGKQTFYINSADGQVRYNDFFVQEFIPFIEHKYLVRRERATRGVSGISMGGYGALRFAFAYPQLFGSVSAQSAALMTATPQDVNTAIRAGTALSRMLGAVFGRPINLTHWRANDPFLLARKNHAALRKTAIYFNCGDHDGYGFEKGAQALDRQLKTEGVPHVFHLYPGDHSLAYFLSHLAETMQLHWRVFNAAR